MFVLSGQVRAQDESCEATLTHATQEFQAGHFYSIPAILSSCLDKFTPEQRQRANLLLTETYLLLDDPMGAKRSYMEVLKANPEFIGDPNVHPIEIVYLSKKFTTSPVFAWFGKAGTNVSPVWVIQDNDIFGQASAQEEYNLKPGFQIGAGGDMYLYESFDLRAELNYVFATYEHTTTKYFEEDTKKVKDNQTWLTIPVMINYHPFRGTYQPYFYAGYSASLLLRDIVNVTIKNIRTAEAGTDEKESPGLNFYNKRNKWNQAIVLGGGIKVKFGLDFLFADVRYCMGLKNIVSSTNLYADNSLDPTSEGFTGSGLPAFSYAHVDDYFRLDNVSVSFGLLRPLYKPRELKRSRTRSLSKKINEVEK
jgi:hypothetical protein